MTVKKTHNPDHLTDNISSEEDKISALKTKIKKYEEGIEQRTRIILTNEKGLVKASRELSNSNEKYYRIQLKSSEQNDHSISKKLESLEGEILAGKRQVKFHKDVIRKYYDENLTLNRRIKRCQTKIADSEQIIRQCKQQLLSHHMHNFFTHQSNREESQIDSTASDKLDKLFYSRAMNGL